VAEEIFGKKRAVPIRDCLINFLLWDIRLILEMIVKLLKMALNRLIFPPNHLKFIK
jgi:hypothetical protein